MYGIRQLGPGEASRNSSSKRDSAVEFAVRPRNALHSSVQRSGSSRVMLLLSFEKVSGSINSIIIGPIDFTSSMLSAVCWTIFSPILADH